MFDLDAIAKQEPFAELIGVSQPAVSRHLKTGVLPAGGTYREWLRALYLHLRDTAAGRAGSGGEFDLVDERARLARAQAERVEMENDVTRGTLAPRALLEDALGSVSRQIVTVLEGLPGRIKKRSAGIKQRELDIIRDEIVKIRRLAARVRLDDGDATASVEEEA